MNGIFNLKHKKFRVICWRRVWEVIKCVWLIDCRAGDGEAFYLNILFKASSKNFNEKFNFLPGFYFYIFYMENLWRILIGEFSLNCISNRKTIFETEMFATFWRKYTHNTCSPRPMTFLFASNTFFQKLKFTKKKHCEKKLSFNFDNDRKSSI